MTLHDLKTRYPRASQSFIEANLSADCAGPVAVVERCVGHEPLAEDQAEIRLGRRFLVRVTSRRRRLLDEDNLCEKYHVDLLRYCGVLPSDAPGRCKIEVTQTQVGKHEPEEVVMEVFQA